MNILQTDKHITQLINQEETTLLKTIRDIAIAEQLDCYLVGGYIRDLLLERKKDVKDMDFVVVDPNKSIEKLGVYFAKKVVEKLKGLGKVTSVKIQKNFGTAQFKFNGHDIEFVGARKESYDRTSRKPIIEDGTLEDDSLRRDFKINDIYLPLRTFSLGYLYDPFNGYEDLKNKLIDSPRDPNITFSDDPLRMMRAVRFATVLNFNLSEKVEEAIKNNIDRLKIISAERITDELNKILKSRYSHRGIQLMADLGLLKFILPELYALKGKDWKIGSKGEKVYHKDNLNHVILVLKNIDNSKHWDNLWMKWAGLLHDLGKKATKRFDPNGDGGRGQWTFHGHQLVSVKMSEKIFKRMKLPMGFEKKYCLFLVEYHEKVKLPSKEVTDSAIRRLITETQELLGDEKYLKDLFNFCIHDVTSSIPERKKRYSESFNRLSSRVDEVVERDNLRNFQPPVSGDELMEMFNLKPSREVGILKNELKDAILEGRVKNDYQDCYNYIINYASVKLNLKISTNEEN
jgi:poly(A) polymerase